MGKTLRNDLDQLRFRCMELCVHVEAGKGKDIGDLFHAVESMEQLASSSTVEVEKCAPVVRHVRKEVVANFWRKLSLDDNISAQSLYNRASQYCFSGSWLS